MNDLGVLSFRNLEVSEGIADMVESWRGDGFSDYQDLKSRIADAFTQLADILCLAPDLPVEKALIALGDFNELIDSLRRTH